MKGKGKKAADEKILLALACGATHQAAATAAGVSERTVSRRMKEPAFQQRLRELRAEIMQRVSGNLVAASTEASRTLVALMKPDQPASVRLGASRTILEFTLKVRESSDLETRMVMMEAVLGDTK